MCIQLNFMSLFHLYSEYFTNKAHVVMFIQALFSVSSASVCAFLFESTPWKAEQTGTICSGLRCIPTNNQMVCYNYPLLFVAVLNSYGLLSVIFQSNRRLLTWFNIFQYKYNKVKIRIILPIRDFIKYVN